MEVDDLGTIVGRTIVVQRAKCTEDLKVAKLTSVKRFCDVDDPSSAPLPWSASGIITDIELLDGDT